ncbi:Inorganic H+ pyrophosphatase [Musa troglodytarum]|uniref:H(+)-exporting diphosphatase n=1 Tax=Musa troglodytarum TaxID=320322 RepID=A0A9E7K2X5_9LILI|nr:Inorganic H+ pyrophosphatase [Musa troglodytarum]
MGMLSTAAYVLTMDMFGPIADNAGGIVEMSLQVDIAIPEVFIGGLLGSMLLFVFSAWACSAVGRTAQEVVVNEVRRQFVERPGIMEYQEKSDYGRCVAIVAAASLREMIKPGFFFRLLGHFTGQPLLGAKVVASMLMFATVAGILMALFLNTAGGAWDNAKSGGGWHHCGNGPANSSVCSSGPAPITASTSRPFYGRALLIAASSTSATAEDARLLLSSTSSAAAVAGGGRGGPRCALGWRPRAGGRAGGPGTPSSGAPPWSWREWIRAPGSSRGALASAPPPSRLSPFPAMHSNLSWLQALVLRGRRRRRGKIPEVAKAKTMSHRREAEASGGDVGRIFPRASTMPKGTKYAEKSETSSEEPNLERSKTEKHGQNSPHDDPRAQLFDDKIPDKQKMKMLNQIATVKDDGTLVVDVPSNFETTSINLRSENTYSEAVDEEPLDLIDLQYRPPMQIVILIVGTRGDVQPFVAIGKRLQGYGHRVRLATQVNFREFVFTAGLEFYPLGGDPKILAEYMVKNKGFLPSSPSEIRTQRKQIKEIMFSLLPACKEADNETGVPFKADSIIANPPAYGHTRG